MILPGSPSAGPAPGVPLARTDGTAAHMRALRFPARSARALACRSARYRTIPTHSPARSKARNTNSARQTTKTHWSTATLMASPLPGLQGRAP